MGQQQTLESGLQKMQINATEMQIKQMLGYLELLTKWNKTHNLTAITDPSEMITLHLLDSLSVLSFIKGPRVLDVGSGAGLPGLILAIMLPDIHFMSVDSRGKKVQFQMHAAASLGLNNFTAENARIEKFQTEQLYDQIISRAFSNVSNFLFWTNHLIDRKGQWLAMKGRYPVEEVQQLKQEPNQTNELFVPEFDGERHLLIFQNSTNA